jgi:hypothetical protein
MRIPQRTNGAKWPVVLQVAMWHRTGFAEPPLIDNPQRAPEISHCGLRFARTKVEPIGVRHQLD